MAVRLGDIRSSQTFLADALEACEAFKYDHHIPDNVELTPMMEALERASINDDSQAEISRYFPIALIACIEGYFRLVFADLINHGSPYKENASKFDIKFTIDTAISLEKHSVSLGEFVAHLLPLNNLEDINANMSTLMGESFLAQFKKKRAETATQLHLFPTSDEEIDARIIGIIKRLFEKRHMYCHELYPPVTDSDDSFFLKSDNGASDAAIEFLWVSEAGVKELIAS